MNSRKVKVMFIMLLTLSILLAACGGTKETDGETSPAGGGKGSSEKGVTVSFIRPASQVNYGGFKDLIAKWEERSGNKVDLQVVQDDQYDNLVQARLTGGDNIDIFQGSYQKFDVPNQLLEISGEAFESELNDVALAALKFTDGKIYAFPGAGPLGSWGVFYNKKVFADLGLQVPGNSDEFNALLAKMKDAGTTPFFFAAKDGWTMLQHRNAVNGIVGMDPAVWDQLNANKIQWKDVAPFVEQYKALEDWVAKSYINKDALTATYDQQQQALADGKAALVIHGGFFVTELLKKDPKAEIGFFPLPTKDGKTAVALSGTDQFYISAKSKNIDAAKDLLRFLVEKEQAQYYLERQPGISAFKNVSVTDLLPESFKEMQAVIDKGNVSRHGDEVYVVPMPNAELIAAYSELLAGRITADQFVEKHGQAYVKNAQLANIGGFK